MTRVKALPANHRLYLVVKNLQTDIQPGVLYHLYLELPEKAKIADEGKAHYVGALSFFGASHSGDDHKVEKKEHETEKKVPEKFKSYDITDLVKTLFKDGKLKEKPVLTIVPVGQPIAEAKPMIGEITIVEQ